MKFGQLIGYDMRHTFLEKSYSKCGGETILRPFSKKPKLSTVFTRKSAYARKSASLELAPPFWREIFNERLPRISAPLFSLKKRSFEK